MDKAAQAREMFAQGYTIRNVADRVGVDFQTARGWKHEFDAVKERQKVQQVTEMPAAQTEDTEEDEVPHQAFELSVPQNRMVDIFSTFTVDEQGMAIATVLQDRLNRALDAFDASGEGANDQTTEGAAA